MTTGRRWGETFDSLWARLSRVLAFMAGIGIMAHETLADRLDRPWLYAAAIGLMGLPVARAAEGLLGRLGPGSGPGTTSDPYESERPEGERKGP